MTEQEIALIAQLQAILEAAKTTTPITPGDPITKALLFFDTFPNLTLCYFDAVEKIDEIPTADRIFFKALANRIRPEVSSKLMPISLTETLGKNGNLGLHIQKLALQITTFI